MREGITGLIRWVAPLIANGKLALDVLRTTFSYEHEHMGNTYMCETHFFERKTGASQIVSEQASERVSEFASEERAS